MVNKKNMICVAAFAGAHGVQGDAKLRSFTQVPRDVFSYGPLTAEKSGKIYEVKPGREAKPGIFIIRTPMIKTREEAIALKGENLLVPRNMLPPPDEDEFYYEDLVGLKAVPEEGASAGKVKAVSNHGAGDILELMNVPGRKGAVMVAFTKEAVPVLDFEKGVITVILPEEGGAPEPDEDR